MTAFISRVIAVLTILLVGWDVTYAQETSSGASLTQTITIESDGWQLVGDWQVPDEPGPYVTALLLHGAAGNRGDYARLAEVLAQKRIASLRLDLRAHGDSINLGKFQEPYREHRHLNEEAYKDINAALAWLAARDDVDAARIAVLGASYSGEKVGEALRDGGPKAAAYVMLSPGSFSEASADLVAGSGVQWLFMRTSEEGPVSKPFIDEVFALVAERAPDNAEIVVIEGAGHAADILERHPETVNMIAD